MLNNAVKDGIVMDEAPPQDEPLSLDQIKMDDTPDLSIIPRSQEPFRASMTSLKKLRSSWNDPITAYNDADRVALAPLLESMDPKVKDETLKRNHLIAYYSNMNHKEFDFVDENLDSFIEEFHGKKMPVDQAYAEVGQIMSGQKAPESKSAVGAYMDNAWKSFQISATRLGQFGMDAFRESAVSMRTGENLMVTEENKQRTMRYKSLSGREQADLTFLDMQEQSILTRSGAAADPAFEEMGKSEMGKFLLAVSIDPLTKDEAESQLKELRNDRDRLKRRYAVQKAAIFMDNSVWEIADEYSNLSVTYLKEDKKENSPVYDDHPDMDPEQVLNKYGKAAAAKKLAVVIADTLPGTLIPIAIGLATKSLYLALGISAAQSMGDRYDSLIDDKSITDEAKFANVFSHGIAEIIFENRFGVGKYLEMFQESAPLFKAAAPGIARRIGSFIADTGEAVVSNTVEELATTATNEIANFATGVDENGRKISEMEKGEYVDYLRSQLINTGIVAPFIGGPMGAGVNIKRQIGFSDIEAARSKARTYLEAKGDELRAKKDLMDDEVVILKTVDTALESNDMNAVVGVNISRAIEAYSQMKNPSGVEQPNHADITGEEDAAAASREYQELSKLPHHPDDTAVAVDNLRREFPGLKVETFDGVANMPEAGKTAAKARSHDTGDVNGFVSDGVIYVNTRNVAPRDVPALILQEYIGHAGMEAAFPSDQLDPFLDLIARDYASQVAEFAAEYAPGDPQVANNYDVTTEKGKRNAAKEFLAHGAVQEIRPAYWKELVLLFKQFLRKIPGLRNVRFSTREIEGMLSKAYRHMKGRKKSVKQGVKFALADKIFEDVASKLPKEKRDENLLDYTTDEDKAFEMAAKALAGMPEVVKDSKGKEIWLRYPEKKQLGERVHHLIRDLDEKTGTRNTLDPMKLRWIPMIRHTIEKAQVKLIGENGNGVYVRRYDDGVYHMVVVTPEGKLLDHGDFGLITHLPKRGIRKHLSFGILWGRDDLNDILGEYATTGQQPTPALSGDSYGVAPTSSENTNTESQSPEKSNDKTKFSFGKFDFNRQIGDHLQKKYPELYAIDEDYELDTNFPKMFETMLEDNTLSSKQLESYLAGLSTENKPAAIQDLKALLSDKLGDLMETYRYEGEKDGQAYEKYIDSLVRVLDKVSGKKGKNPSAQGKGKTASSAAVSDNSGVDSQPEQGVLFSLGWKKRNQKEEQNPILSYLKEELGTSFERIKKEWKQDQDKGTERDYGVDTYINGAFDKGLINDELMDQSSFLGMAFAPDTTRGNLSEDAYWQQQEEKFRKEQGTYYSPEETRLMARYLRPLVSKLGGIFPDPQVAYDTLKKGGFRIHSVSDARMMILESRRYTLSIQADIRTARKNKWMSGQYPVISRMIREYGDKIRVKPSPAFIKEIDFNNGAAGVYLQKKGGKNTKSSAEVARKLGIDEDELLDALKGVTARKINDSYRAHVEGKKNKNTTFTKAFAEVQKNRDFALAVEVAQGRKPLTDDIITERKGAAKQIYEMVMGEPLPIEPHWQAVKDRIAEDYPINVEQMQAEKEAAKVAMPDKLEEVISAITAHAEMNIEKLQAILKDYARTAITDANLAKSIMEDVSRLTEYTSEPTTAFPEGRQSAMLEDVLQKIIGARESIDRSNMIKAIDDLLSKTNLRRVGKGRVVSLYAEAQKELDNIREFRNMSPSTVLKLIEYHQQAADGLINEGKDASEHQLAAATAETFGMLEEKSPEQLSEVYRQLDQLARHGRNQLKQFLAERKSQVEIWRNESKNLITGGKGLMTAEEFSKVDAKRKIWGGDSVLQVQDLEMLLSWITRDSGQSFQDTMMYNEFFKRVHQSFQNKMTGIRERRKNFEDEINRIFGTTGTRSRAKLMGELKTQVENSGVSVYRRDPNDKSAIKYKRIAVEDARLLLKQYEEAGTGLTDYQAEAVRQRLADLDERLKDAVKARTEDEFTDDILNAILSENDKNIVVIPEITQPGTLTEKPLSQLQALYFRLCWDQSTVRYKMAFNGWTEESIRQLDKFIRPEVRELGKYMVADLAKDFPNIQEVYKKLYMTTMKGSDGYFPTSYDVKKEIAAANAAELGNLYSGQMSVTPGTLSARKFHLMEPKVEDAVSMYTRHVLQMEHFKSHAETARDLCSLFNSRDVSTAIRQYYGADVQNYLNKKIEDFTNGGKFDAQNDVIVNRIQSVFARTRIWWNSVSMYKQMVGATQYMNDIPTSAFIGGVADFMKDPVGNMNMLRETDYFKNRWAGSVDRDVGLLISRHRYSAEEGANFFNQLDEVGSLPTRAGDAFSVIVGGYAVYKYHYDNLIKEGLSKPDAHKQALQEWEMSTERTQQSGAAHKMNRYQLDGSWSRVWTTFQSNPMLIANAFIESAMDVKAGRGLKGAAYAKLARRAFTAWIIGGFMMSVIGQAAKNGFDFDEYEWMRVGKDTLMGPFSSYTVLGYLVDAGANFAFGLRENSSFGSGGMNDIGAALRSGHKLVDGDFEDGEEIWKLVEKGFIGLGYVPSPIAPAAIHGGGIMRELRRYWNLAFGEEKKSKHETIKL